jgi:ADP-heptose:LPS heptosyltransferase
VKKGLHLTDTFGLFVAVDTSIVHLAGALRKPVCVVLPFDPDRRWRRERPDSSSCFDTVTLIQQANPGDWGSALGPLAE